MTATGRRGRPGWRGARGEDDLTPLQRYILDYLRGVNASYARPVRSAELAQQFNITDSYAREQTRPLVVRGLVAVRGGPKGGYYLAGNVTTAPKAPGQ